MNEPQLIPIAGLALLLVLAMVWDSRSRRIPNLLILAGWGYALIWNLLGKPGVSAFDPQSPGATGLFGWLLGAAALLLAFMPFYVLRIMGAGDVKLMSVVGGFFGASADAWAHLFGVSLTVLVCGGLLSIARIMISRNRAAVVANLKTIFYGVLLRRSGAPAPVFDPATDSADRMPYAVAIALGTLLYVVGKWAGWITVL